MTQTTPSSDLVRDAGSLREAIAALRAEHGVSETGAYAILVRAAAGSTVELADHRAPSSPTPLAG